MSWLLLVIAGLFEVGFATCLGKARETGSNTVAWMTGFFGAKSSKEGKEKKSQAEEYSLFKTSY